MAVSAKGGEVVSGKDGGVAVRLVMVIPYAGAGMIVGQQGKTIKAINEKTGAFAALANSTLQGDPSRKNLIITGSRAQVHRAKDELLTVMLRWLRKHSGDPAATMQTLLGMIEEREEEVGTTFQCEDTGSCDAGGVRWRDCEGQGCVPSVRNNEIRQNANCQKMGLGRNWQMNDEISKQIMAAQPHQLCTLIAARKAEFDKVHLATAFRKLLQSRSDGVLHGVVERALQALEECALEKMEDFQPKQVATYLHSMAKCRYHPSNPRVLEALEQQAAATAGTFNEQEVANTLWAYAKLGREPGARLMWGLECRAEAVVDKFNAQGMANTLWAYATMGRNFRSGVMRGLAGRAEALAGTFTTQDVANMLWAFCVMSVLGVPDEDSRWVHKIEQRLVSLAKHACFASSELSQLHQFFVWCDVEKRKQQLEATIDMRVFKEKCRSEFEKAPTAPSTTQRQVSETLRRMGLSVEDEVRCPKSGYSIDMLVSGLGMGGEISSGVRTWAVEVDGPSHFFASKTPTGVTLLKRRHLQLLGHALVSVPYWEWDGFNGLGSEGVAREQYLRGKLEDCVQTPGNSVSET